MMRNSRKTLLLMSSLIGLVGCGGNNATTLGGNSYGGDLLSPDQRQQIATTATKALNDGIAPKVIAGVNNFGFELLAKLHKADPSKNICVSPVSAAAVIAMLYNGASGDTQRQMAQSLGVGKFSSDQINDANKNLWGMLTNVDPGKVSLTIADSLWVKSGLSLNPDYSKKCQDVYDAKISTLDFASNNAPDIINGWVKEKTGGKISTLVEKIPEAARLYAINAVYFKGQWKQPFDKRNTRPGDFFLLDGKKVSVPMMSQTGSFPYFANAEATGVTLPYGTGRLEMLLLLPSTKLGIAGAEKKLASGAVNEWTKQMANKQVAIMMPTYRADYSASLNESLKAMGITSAFDANKADFSGILAKGAPGNAERLVLSQVKQKTYVNVDEQGTEAAAATSAEVVATAMPLTVGFKADRPFLYVIRDSQTGAVLFVGAVTDPSKEPAVALGAAKASLDQGKSTPEGKSAGDR